MLVFFFIYNLFFLFPIRKLPPDLVSEKCSVPMLQRMGHMKMTMLQGMCIINSLGLLIISFSAYLYYCKDCPGC